MSVDLKKFLQEQRLNILEESRRLGLLLETKLTTKTQEEQQICDKNEYQHNNLQQSSNYEDKENFPRVDTETSRTEYHTNNNIEQVHLKCNEVDLEKSKEAFIDKLSKSENPFTFRANDKTNRAMLRYGEYSPNNPQLRVTAAPYIGLGEYEHRRNYLLQQQKADYLRHLAKKNQSLKELSKTIVTKSSKDNENTSKYSSPNITKTLCSTAVQTDLKNIHCKLIQYELNSNSSPEKELSPQSVDNYIMQNNRNYGDYSRVDQRLTSAQNALLKPEMDKPKSILSNRRTGSPRERMMSDLQHSYTPSFMDGFSYQDRTEELERERLKREVYQHELRLQIEEKRRFQAMRDEQERHEQELENRRLEQQLLRMQEEHMIEEQRRNRRDEQMRRHNEDLIRRKQELQSRHSYRKHTDSESSVTSLRNTDVASKAFSHYSPPVSRRNPYSFNIPSTSVFADPTTRHSATQQDLSLFRKSPKLQRRSSCSRFDDTLPIPVLKARSPVARELKNSIPFNSSRHSSDAVRKLEDKWQIPAVQKNIVNHNDVSKDGQNRSVLTQLGAIRMQLQREQLRMDETLKNRGVTQSKAVDFN